jgi:putative nucleotidyltransferase with HDIG domain
MKCPGQDSRYWDSSAIFDVKCPVCGNADEFFKDESTRKCKKCGHKIVNPKKNFGCAAYCKFAEQCLGELPEGLIAERQNSNNADGSNADSFKNRVAAEMRSYFGDDYKRIRHAAKVAGYAEQIAKETGADMAVVLSAAFLHDIGIKAAEQKYNSNAAKYQEELGPDIARQILTALNADSVLIDKVCDIIGHHHHPGKNESAEFKALYDADQIVNIQEDDVDSADSANIPKSIEKRLLTDLGRKLAVKILLPVL